MTSMTATATAVPQTAYGQVPFFVGERWLVDAKSLSEWQVRRARSPLCQAASPTLTRQVAGVVCVDSRVIWSLLSSDDRQARRSFIPETIEDLVASTSSA